jgi:CheY-like chemotaxis protein/pimeloyl-ACP methyl ester carboxylesterase
VDANDDDASIGMSSYADSTTRRLGRSQAPYDEDETRNNLPRNFSQKLRPDRDEGFMEGTESRKGVEEAVQANPPLGTGKKVNEYKGGKQVLNASSVLDEVAEREAAAATGGRRVLVDQSVMVAPSHNKDFEGNHFRKPLPDAFACRGQYCRLHIGGVGPLTTDREREAHIGQKLFSQKELNTLKKDKQFSAMMDFSADGPGTAQVSMKSIILAAREMRQDTVDHDTEDWRKYPLTPRSKHDLISQLHRIEKEAYMNEDSSLADDQKEEAVRQAAALEQLKMDREVRDTFSKGMASYYKQVLVCGTCCKVYALLDWSRGLLGFDDAYGAGKEGKGPAARTAQAGPNLTAKIMGGSKGGRGKRNRKGGVAAGGSKDSADDWWTSEEPTPHHSKPGSPRQGRQGSAARGGSASRSKSPKKGTYDQTGGRRAAAGEKQRADHDMEVRQGKKTWKDYAYDADGNANPNQKKIGNAEFRDVDAYLRGGAYKLTKRKEVEREASMKKRVADLVKEEQEIAKWNKKAEKDKTRGEFDFSDDESDDDLADTDGVAANMYCGKVLLVYQDREEAYQARQYLEETYFRVTWSKDGRQALNDFFLAEGDFDCVLVQRDIPLADAFAITSKVREFEKRERHRAAAQMAEQGLGRQPNTRRRAVICFTTDTLPEDLKLYMKADMDGCVSVPPSKVALLNTVRAAVPQHLAIMAEEPPPPDRGKAQVFHMQDLGVLEGAQDSATVAAQGMPIAQGNNEDEYAYGGVVQIDADTRVPYQILDCARNAKVSVNPKKPFFNLVVCHDLFDTLEKMKIFFKPIIQKYLGMQILVWNYPGQAFSEWREEQLLNNEYHATCLNEVLGQLGEGGTKEFDTTVPFFMLGYGHGLSVASFYAAYYAVPNLRGVISINGWSFVDSYLAGAMHDCGNIFHCSPASRPDLPVYFFSRFLFSKDYLARVSVPLALNIYTAVHNPITLAGRINLTKGVLAAVDVRPLLKEIECPIIAIQSTEDSFARPLHTEPLASCRGGEVRSIYKVLKNPTKTCVIWMKSGHEIFQESKKEIQMLLEQILTGFHESHDISFPPAPMVDAISTDQGTLMANLPGGQNR